MMTERQGILPKVRVAVVTHARREPFFCAMWSQYYGEIFGYENLFLVKDGADWELPPAARFGAVIPVEFPKKRIECDRYAMRFLSQECAKLLNEYDVVLRTDVDEFLVVDPRAGTWDDVWAETKANGYIFAVGLDVVHNEDNENPFDFGKPILEQRRFAYVRGDFCKPCAIARAMTWTSAFSLENQPVILSSALKLVHLASMDRKLQEDRLSNRGDFSKVSYVGHAMSRFRRFEMVKSDKAYDLDEVAELVNLRLSFDDDGSRSMSPRFVKMKTPDGKVHKRQLCVRSPDRYAQLISAPQSIAPANET